MATTNTQAKAAVPYRQIRALHDDTLITVYQAYKASIADAAVKAQRLNASPDFRPGRMTWVKPSWSWMMYRAGYSYKDPGQERILALRMKHQHFLALLERGVLSTHVQKQQPASTAAAAEAEATGGSRSRREKSDDVRIQWDPERTPKLEVLPYRSIQIGIPGSLSGKWADEWIVEVEDVTETARELKRVIDERPDVTVDELIDLDLVPQETPFEVPEALRQRLCMNPPSS